MASYLRHPRNASCSECQTSFDIEREGRPIELFVAASLTEGFLCPHCGLTFWAFWPPCAELMGKKKQYKSFSYTPPPPDDSEGYNIISQPREAS